VWFHLDFSIDSDHTGPGFSGDQGDGNSDSASANHVDIPESVIQDLQAIINGPEIFDGTVREYDEHMVRM
jgi:hypothetical protein